MPASRMNPIASFSSRRLRASICSQVMATAQLPPLRWDMQPEDAPAWRVSQGRQRKILLAAPAPPAEDAAMPRVLLALALLAASVLGCAKPEERTVEVHGPDGGRYYATVFHFLAAADDYERAVYVHGG